MVNGRVCFLMQLCSNGDLAARITKQGGVPFEFAKIVQWFEQLSEGVKYIHTRKVLHRDLKVSIIL